MLRARANSNPTPTWAGVLEAVGKFCLQRRCKPLKAVASRGKPGGCLKGLRLASDQTRAAHFDFIHEIHNLARVFARRLNSVSRHREIYLGGLDLLHFCTMVL